MTTPLIMAGIAGVCAVLLGVAAVGRKGRSLASWAFFLGMAALAVDGVLSALAVTAAGLDEGVVRMRNSLTAKAFLPGLWLTFSLVYSRGNARGFLKRWATPLAAAFVVPIGVVLGFRSGLVEVVFTNEIPRRAALELGGPAKLLSAAVLLASIFVLVNLEKTIRAAVGTQRWRVKYVFLGVGLIFGARVYTESQVLLYSGYLPSVAMVESAALLLGCVLIAVAYLREGFDELDIYPSRAVLHGSLTIVLAGAYLIVVGVLAQIVARVGWEYFPGQAFVILVGVVGLAILLLSDRLRARFHRFITRHFGRPEHDFREAWTELTRKTSEVLEPRELCRVTAELISETFNALTVDVYRFEPEKGRLVKAASTDRGGASGEGPVEVVKLEDDEAGEVKEHAGLFNLERDPAGWAEGVREATPRQFPERGGARMAMPLVSGERLLGVLVMADRVDGVPYSQEERELLACIAEQLAAALWNRALSEDVTRRKELEAFQTMSTFFVHDLKNAANSLTLLLENLPRHFDDPEFRKDALRATGRAVDRINSMIERLTTLRGNLELRRVESDLNVLIDEALASLPEEDGGPEIERERSELPEIPLDRDQIASVVTNLVVNAREAVGAAKPDGRVGVRTMHENGNVVMVVEDNGCGMSEEFIEQSLFRPFTSTKSKGLGVGMFQVKRIVEAHGGTIRVESTPHMGTRFQVSLPDEAEDMV